MPDPTPPSSSKQHVFQAPTGTRDLYPVEAARRRFIMDAWRKVSINHGFEEIDGPTFEHLDLYTVKSGEGIVSELFSFERAGGEKTYALRPEFTPTLARMYASKAASLPKPTKWFTAGPFFRAERPQRGRLREFLQWNCDILGAEDDLNRRICDAEIIAVLVDLLRSMGFKPEDARVKIGSRRQAHRSMQRHGISEARADAVIAFLDQRPKLKLGEYKVKAAAMGLPQAFIEDHDPEDPVCLPVNSSVEEIADYFEVSLAEAKLYYEQEHSGGSVSEELTKLGVEDWCEFDSMIVRGLAYYTGTVFEVIVDNERAVAGGGRYDNLIEMFGGPPTPAVGFGMGDVVLSLVLQDKGLMPSDAQLMGIAGQWPDAFVISNGTLEADAAVPAVLASLRRGMSVQEREEKKLGSESRPTLGPDYGLHARRSYKSTKNIGKLLQDAVKCNARFAVIVESATEATIKDIRTSVQDQNRTPIADLPAELRKRLA